MEEVAEEAEADAADLTAEVPPPMEGTEPTGAEVAPPPAPVEADMANWDELVNGALDAMPPADPASEVPPADPVAAAADAVELANSI